MRARALKFAEQIANGSTQINAWREVTPNWVNLAETEQHNQAYRFANHPIVEAEVKQRMQSASLASYMSASQFAARMAHRADMLISEAPTASAAYDRLLGQSLGVLRDNLTVDSKNIPIDKLLADAVAAGMPLAAAKRLLGVVDSPTATLVELPIAKSLK